MTLFGYTLRFLRARRNLTLSALAKALGLGITTLENIESGYIQPEEALAKEIAAYFGVTVGYMKGSVEFSAPPTDADKETFSSPTRYVRLRPVSLSGPDMGTALRQGTPAEEIVLPLPASDRSEYIAVEVTDNSMARYRALSGDVLVVRDDALKIRSGDLVLLLTDEGHAILRRYFREGDEIVLRSDNDDLLPPIRLGDCDKTCRLVGTVVKIMIDTDAEFMERRAQNPPRLPDEILPPPDMEAQKGGEAAADYMYLYK